MASAIPTASARAAGARARARTAGGTSASEWTCLALLAVITTVLRSWRITAAMQIEGDQIRDWTLALGPFRQLPLTGTPSTMGGSSIGPVYYWTLWAIRHTLGPWMDNLPHAGAIGLSLIEGAADALLGYALLKRSGSILFAGAAVLLIATATHEMALGGTIWNPTLAVALVKAATAMTLLAPADPSSLLVVTITMLAWLAVQAHSTSLFVAAPVIACPVVRALFQDGWRRAAGLMRTIVEIILVLEVPFLIDQFHRGGGDAGPTKFFASAGAAAVRPGTIHVVSAFGQMSTAIGRILTQPWSLPAFTACLGAAMIVTAFRARRDLALASVTVLPLVTAAAAFGLWQGAYDEYWFLTLAPPAALTIVFALTAFPATQRVVSLALLTLAVVAVPARFRMAQQMYHMPEYQPLVRGSRAIIRQAPEVTAIGTDFPLRPTVDRTFIYRILGGRISPNAAYAATIGRSGDVRFRRIER